MLQMADMNRNSRATSKPQQQSQLLTTVKFDTASRQTSKRGLLAGMGAAGLSSLACSLAQQADCEFRSSHKRILQVPGDLIHGPVALNCSKPGQYEPQAQQQWQAVWHVALALGYCMAASHGLEVSAMFEHSHQQ